MTFAVSNQCFAAIMALMSAIFVIGQAEMYAFAVSNYMKETGLAEADTGEVSDKIIGDLVNSFSEFPLSEDTVANMTGLYVDKLDQAMGIKTKLKKGDADNPDLLALG